MTYNELLCRMMADAYYMVNEYHLNLGPNDSLEKIVKIVFEQTGLSRPRIRTRFTICFSIIIQRRLPGLKVH